MLSKQGSIFRGPKPFRFEQFWHKEASRGQIIKQAWFHRVVGSSAYQLCRKLGCTKLALQKWNRDIVGFRPHKIRSLHQQLSDLEGQPTSEEIEETLFSVRATLQKVLKQEEDLWKSKSRVQWLMTSDMNNKFFHLSTVIRRRGNDIVLLQDSMGCWHSDRLEVGNFLVDHFMTLYNSSNPIMSPVIFEVFTPLVSDSENLFLCKKPDESEILGVVKQLGGSKAPVPMA